MVKLLFLPFLLLGFIGFMTFGTLCALASLFLGGEAMTLRNEDTILHGALEPKPCSIYEDPVYSELQQALTPKIYCKIVYTDCESTYLWGQF